MNEEKKRQKLSLILGTVLAVLGVAMIVVAVVVDQILRHSPYQKSEWYIYVLEILGALITLIAVFNLRYYFAKRYNLKQMNIKQMAVVSIFAAFSILLYYIPFLKFSLPFFPKFLEIQFSDVPALIPTFMYGPWTGATIIVIRFICKLPGTMTVGVGELADLLIGLALCIVSGLIYKKHRTLKGAFVSLTIGMLFATFVATFSNWLILIPAYINITGMTMDNLVGFMSYLGGFVTAENFMIYYLFIAVVPFNLFRYLLVFIITILLYKRLSVLIEHFTGDYIKEENDEESTENVENQEISCNENA